MSDTKQEILDGIAEGSIHGKLFTPLSAEEIDELVERAKTDPGAAFESQAVARMAATKRADLPTFMRLRERLKDTKTKVSELDSELDKVLNSGRAAGEEDKDKQGRPIKFHTIEPWPEEVEGAVLLDEIAMNFQRYVKFSCEAAPVAIALWVVHTHCFGAFAVSPRLAVISPVKRCGKSRVLRVIKPLVPKPLTADNITAAALFRTIEKHQPTFLIDEADSFLGDADDLRGILNSGFERDGQVVRLVGDDHEPSTFSTYCATAIACIKDLPETLMDRSVVIAMRRRSKSEPIERFRSDRAGHLHELQRKIARWAADHGQALRDADPDVPEELDDRAADKWRPLFAIADRCRWDHPQAARAAALALSGQEAERDDQSIGVMLLHDIKIVFDDRQKKGDKDAGRISSTDLRDRLVALDDRPWATWFRGKQITAARVARLLKDFGIFPNTIKLSDGKQPNGYKRSQFDDAFARYLPQPPGPPVQSSPSSPTPANPWDSGQSQGSPQGASGEVSESAQSLEKQGVGEDGELSSPHSGSLDDNGDSDDLPAGFFDEIMERRRRREAEAGHD
jgi:putative DNA primase/helicase